MTDSLLLQETGAPGWAEVAAPGLAARVLIKITKRGERWAVTRLIVDGDVDAATLKRLPISRIESSLNAENGLVGRGIARQDTYNDPTIGQYMHSHEDDFAAFDTALAQYLETSQKPDFGPPPGPIPALSRPDGSDPDAFYRQVARVYDATVITTSAPAKAMAERASVPVTTVHRWINEARRRGFLPPARKGRAG